MNLYVLFLLIIWKKQKLNLFFINMNIKVKFNFFSHNKLKFQPRTNLVQSELLYSVQRELFCSMWTFLFNVNCFVQCELFCSM